jgi:hypothetical protein
VANNNSEGTARANLAGIDGERLTNLPADVDISSLGAAANIHEGTD